MRKPIDLHAELKALRKREDQLKAEHREQLAELLGRTKADQLPVELLTGALLDLVARHDAGDAGLAELRRKGETFFRPSRARRALPTASSDPSAAGQASSAA